MTNYIIYNHIDSIPKCGRCGHLITNFIEESYIVSEIRPINVAGKIGNQITYQKYYIHKCPDPDIIYWWNYAEDCEEEYD